MKIKQIPNFKQQIIKQLFGLMSNGAEIFTHQLVNANGMELHLTDYGATVTAIKILTNSGQLIDVVLGFDTLQQFTKSKI